MRKATGRVGGSYSYNYTCPVCGIVYKRAEMRVRWDGQLVCEFDWEPRHPMDFFRNRNDVHKLDRLSRDLNPAGESMDGVTGGWAPAWTNITLSGNSTALNGSYRDDLLSTVHVRNLIAEIRIPNGDNEVSGSGGLQSVILAVGNVATALTLPSSPNVAGTFVLRTNRGKIIKTGSIPAGSATLTVTDATAKTVNGYDGNVTFSGNYGL